MSSYRINGEDADYIRKIFNEGEVTKMKRNYKKMKRYDKPFLSEQKVAAVVVAAGVIAGTVTACESNDSYLIPTTTETIISEVVETDPVESLETSITPTVAPTSAVGSDIKETVVNETNTSETTMSNQNVPSASSGTNNTTNPGSGNSVSSGGSGSSGGTGQNSSVTSTPKPTATPKPTPNPYKDRVDCPSCGDDHAVRYREARTVHHDAVTHEEKVVTYDKEIRTFQYTINWTGNFKSWCSDNGFSVPSAPSAKGDVVYDAKGKVIDSSGEKDALNSITEKAHELAADLGYTEVAYSYTTKEVNKSYVNRVETTKTVVDKEAWDETIPAGWYCDNENCSYYSSKEPEAYRDIDL